MATKPDTRTLSGKAALEKTLWLFERITKDLVLVDSTNVTITQSEKGRLVKTMFNISGLDILITLNRSLL